MDTALYWLDRTGSTTPAPAQQRMTPLDEPDQRAGRAHILFRTVRTAAVVAEVQRERVMRCLLGGAPYGVCGGPAQGSVPSRFHAIP